MDCFEFTEQEKREIITRFRSGSYPSTISHELSKPNDPVSEIDILDVIREKLEND